MHSVGVCGVLMLVEFAWVLNNDMQFSRTFLGVPFLLSLPVFLHSFALIQSSPAASSAHPVRKLHREQLMLPSHTSPWRETFVQHGFGKHECRVPPSITFCAIR